MHASKSAHNDQYNSNINFNAFTPTLIIPIVGKTSKVYTVRTLMDSGSKSNWIAAEILPFIKHTLIDTVRLSVQHFNGSTTQTYKVVQIYIKRSDGWLPKRESFKHFGQIYETLDCLVYDGFFHHRQVSGVKDHIRNTGKLPSSVLDHIIDPSGYVDHHAINMGIYSLSTWKHWQNENHET